MLYDQLVAVATSLLLWPLFLPVVGVPTTTLAAIVVVRGSSRYAASDLRRQPVSYAWVWIAWTVLAWEGFVVANALGTVLGELDAEFLIFVGWATLWHGVQTAMIVGSLPGVRRLNHANAAPGGYDVHGRVALERDGAEAQPDEPRAASRFDRWGPESQS